MEIAEKLEKNKDENQENEKNPDLRRN